MKHLEYLSQLLIYNKQTVQSINFNGNVIKEREMEIMCKCINDGLCNKIKSYDFSNSKMGDENLLFFLQTIVGGDVKITKLNFDSI